MFTFRVKEGDVLYLRAFDSSTGIIYELMERPTAHHLVLTVRSIHGTEKKGFFLVDGAALDFWRRFFETDKPDTSRFFSETWKTKWTKVLENYYQDQEKEKNIVKPKVAQKPVKK